MRDNPGRGGGRDRQAKRYGAARKAAEPFGDEATGRFCERVDLSMPAGWEGDGVA